MENIPQWIIAIFEIGASLFLSSGELPPAEPFEETNNQALVIPTLCTQPEGKVILTYQEKGATSSKPFMVEYTSTCLGGLPQTLLLSADKAADVNFLAPDGPPLPTDYNLKADAPYLFSSNVIGSLLSFKLFPSEIYISYKRPRFLARSFVKWAWK